MEVVYASCAGIDIGKRSLTVCVIRSDPSAEAAKETRTFRTLTRDLLALADWLDERGVTAVAMEATGSYWKPIWNLLEDRFELLLANLAHLKAVPGRKTDVRDAEWIAEPTLRVSPARGGIVLTGERQLSKRRRAPNYPAWMVDAARGLYLDGYIPSRIADQLGKVFPAAPRMPDERTLRMWAKRWQSDTSGPWLLDNPAADPGIVLPLLADLVEATGGRIRSVTNAEAMLLTSLGRALPDMPVVTKYNWSRAFIAARDREPTDALIHYLAFTPWRDHGVRYLAALSQGRIAELRSFSADDAEWLPPGSRIRSGPLARKVPGGAERQEVRGGD